mgnify:CR=1 FL=1
MDAITVINLRKEFGDVIAVNDVSFSVREGSIFGYLGPNGAGKTTTLRMIYGALKPTAGEIYVMGYDALREKNEAKKLLGVMPENTGIYPRLTAEENLIYFGRLRGLIGYDLERRVEKLLKRLNLEEKKHVLADKLSSGQRQKLAFARAIIHEPPVLILDEPTLGVDVMSAREIREIIREYADQGGTVVLSTHNMWEVQKLCSDVAIINKGRIVYSGSRAELERISGEKEFEEIFIKLVREEHAEAF